MSFTARPQAIASRTRSVLADWNKGDGVRTARPTGTEARQIAAVVGGTVAFVLIVFAVGVLGLLAR